MGLLLMLLLIPLALIFIFLLPIFAIIDILRSKFYRNDNLLMLLIVLFIPCGAILYFIIAPSKKISNTTI